MGDTKKVLEIHIVPKHVGKIRLSDYAHMVFNTISSRKGIKKAIKRGQVLVDGKIGNTGQWIQAGQKIELLKPKAKPGKIFPLELRVIFEDEYIAIIHKPAGFPVSGNYFKTIQNALPHNLKTSGQKDALTIPLPVHRLDAATSGLLIIAKTIAARIELGRQFEEKAIQKKYRAIVIGETPASGKIELPIDNKEAISEYKTIRQICSPKYNWLSELELNLLTGRTHQLRIHLSKSGFPILGDKLYGKEGMILKGKGLFLCATELSLQHPFEKRILLPKIAPPKKFKTFLDKEENRSIYKGQRLESSRFS